MITKFLLLSDFHWLLFTGALKNSSDVIAAAQRIADAGNTLDNLASSIADVCPDSTAKQVNCHSVITQQARVFSWFTLDQ